jgi:hypothetical protein
VTNSKVKSIKINKKLKTSSSEKSLDYFNPNKGRNDKNNNITKKKNNSNSNWFRTLYMKNDYENGYIKSNNNYLRFNTTIRKKEKSNNQKNGLKNNCNRTTKTRVSNFPNFDLNLKLKKQQKIAEETKDNYLIINQIMQIILKYKQIIIVIIQMYRVSIIITNLKSNIITLHLMNKKIILIIKLNQIIIKMMKITTFPKNIITKINKVLIITKVIFNKII